MNRKLIAAALMVLLTVPANQAMALAGTGTATETSTATGSSTTITTGTTDKTVFTLAELQDMALAANRNMQKIKINTDIVGINENIVKTYRETISDARHYISSSLSDASQELSSAKTQIDNLTDLNNSLEASGTTASLSQLNSAGVIDNTSYAQITAVLGSDGGSTPATTVLSSLLTNLNSAYNEGLTSYTEANSTASSTRSDLLDKENALDDSETSVNNAKEDVTNTSSDFPQELKQIITLFSLKAMQLNDTVILAQKACDLQERLSYVESLKAKLGLGIDTDSIARSVEAATAGTQLQAAQNGLTSLKRQINDLVGRDMAAELTLTPFQLPQDMPEPTPFTEELAAKIIANDYGIYQLNRDISDLEDEIPKLASPNEKKIRRANIQLKKLLIEDAKTTLYNGLKTHAQAAEIAGRTRTVAHTALDNAFTTYNRAQKSLSLGLISPLAAQAAELSYTQAKLNALTADYDYYIACEEWCLLQQGVDLDDYETVKDTLEDEMSE